MNCTKRSGAILYRKCFHELSQCLLNMNLISMSLSLKLLVSTNVNLELDMMGTQMKLQHFLRHFVNAIHANCEQVFTPVNLTVTLEKMFRLPFAPDCLVSTLLPPLLQSRTHQFFADKDRIVNNIQISDTVIQLSMGMCQKSVFNYLYNFLCIQSLSICSFSLVVVGWQ